MQKERQKILVCTLKIAMFSIKYRKFFVSSLKKPFYFQDGNLHVNLKVIFENILCNR